jgi:hypothetical protein
VLLAEFLERLGGQHRAQPVWQYSTTGVVWSLTAEADAELEEAATDVRRRLEVAVAKLVGGP